MDPSRNTESLNHGFAFLAAEVGIIRGRRQKAYQTVNRFDVECLFRYDTLHAVSTFRTYDWIMD